MKRYVTDDATISLSTDLMCRNFIVSFEVFVLHPKLSIGMCVCAWEKCKVRLAVDHHIFLTQLALNNYPKIYNPRQN